jgi:hypothetical protein
MLLGYTKLKRWLALLLASGSKDLALRPVMYAAVRRGLIMEELARSSGDDEMRGEMFICGVFSLLDRMMRQPFAELLKNVPVQARVQSSLMTDEGPYTPHLELVRAIEQGSAVDIREEVGRAREVGDRAGEEDLLDGVPLRGEFGDLRVVGRARADRLLEDRGVRGQARHRQVADVARERPRIEERAGDVVEPERLAEGCETGGGKSCGHGGLRAAEED